MSKGVKDVFKNEGIGRSGTIKLEGLKRELHYILPIRENCQANVTLKYNSSI